MTKYKKNDLIFHTKNGKFEVAVVTEAVNTNNTRCLAVVSQDGKKDIVYDIYNQARLGYNIKKITKKVYDDLGKFYKDIIDNFDAKKAIANYENKNEE